jgi:hypothetical protein
MFMRYVNIALVSGPSKNFLEVFLCGGFLYSSMLIVYKQAEQRHSLGGLRLCVGFCGLHNVC